MKVLGSHSKPASQRPQVPPQLSAPHFLGLPSLSVHLGMQLHWPVTWSQRNPSEHVHALPEQLPSALQEVAYVLASLSSQVWPTKLSLVAYWQAAVDWSQLHPSVRWQGPGASQLHA